MYISGLLLRGHRIMRDKTKGKLSVSFDTFSMDISDEEYDISKSLTMA